MWPWPAPVPQERSLAPATSPHPLKPLGCLLADMKWNLDLKQEGGQCLTLELQVPWDSSQLPLRASEQHRLPVTVAKLQRWHIPLGQLPSLCCSQAGCSQTFSLACSPCPAAGPTASARPSTAQSTRVASTLRRPSSPTCACDTRNLKLCSDTPTHSFLSGATGVFSVQSLCSMEVPHTRVTTGWVGTMCARAGLWRSQPLLRTSSRQRSCLPVPFFLLGLGASGWTQSPLASSDLQPWDTGDSLVTSEVKWSRSLQPRLHPAPLSQPFPLPLVSAPPC